MGLDVDTGERPLEGLLVEAGRLLGASLAVEDTLRSVARLAVPELADWCVVDVEEADGSIRSYSSGHDDPAKDRLLLDLRARHRDARAEQGAPPSGALEVVATGQPRFYRALRAEQLATATEEEQSLWSGLNPIAWMVVPLRSGESTIGALTFLSCDAERVYDERDLPVAFELADRCAQAIANAQAYESSESSRALLDTLFATVPIALGFVDTDLRFRLVNERLAELNGRPVADHLGRPAGEVLVRAGDTVVATFREVLASGEAVVEREIVGDDDRAYLGSYAPVRVEGKTAGVVCAITDVTERRAELQRTARLQAVTEQLSAALTADEVAAVIIEAGMQATGACCGVLALRVNERLMRVEHRFGIPGNPPTDLPLDVALPMPMAVREGRPVLVDTRDEWLRRFARPPGGGFESFAAVPLLFEGEIPGCMGLGFPDAGPFADADVALLVAIARQGAQALDRARLYEERAYVARTLQAGLLPSELPDIPGLDVAVRYRPVGDGAEVGGDFYDLVPLDGDVWLAAVGDVCGKGTASAVLSGVVRSTIRALAVRATAPREILRGVNEALLRESSSAALSTAACATLRFAGRGVAVRISAGGHPPPLVLRAGGSVDVVEIGGPMLGVQPGAELPETTLTLDPGDLLLLYTDGVLDARRGRETFGEDRLRDALTDAAGSDAAATVDAIDAALRAFAPGPPRDDKALLALRAR